MCEDIEKIFKPLYEEEEESIIFDFSNFPGMDLESKIDFDEYNEYTSKVDKCLVELKELKEKLENPSYA